MRTRGRWMTLLALGLLAGRAPGEETNALPTLKDKVSYGIGVDVAGNLKRLGIEVNMDALTRGIKDQLAGQKLLLSDEALKAAMTEMQGDIARKQAQAAKAAGAENMKKGEAFLAENKTKEGVVVLPSGLQYKILKAGQGKKPALTDTVECHYKGTLIDGTEVDSSYRRGQPATFPVNGVIRGWQEALPLMSVGSKWQLFIPSDLAYGPRGAGADIGPDATLIFEIDLLGVK
jgi:FKBP-type peptidyl-prolyl cis-trans isomerase